MDNKVEGNVLVCIDDDGVCRIKLVGNIRYDSSSKGFMDFVNAEIPNEKVKDVIVDMRECSYIDSTDIGILAQIALIQSEKRQKKPTIIYSDTSQEESSVIQAVSDVNVNSLFDLYIGKDINESGYNKLGNFDCSQYEVSKIMYATHKLLSDLDESNKKRFESVVKYLGESATFSAAASDKKR